MTSLLVIDVAGQSHITDLEQSRAGWPYTNKGGSPGSDPGQHTSPDAQSEAEGGTQKGAHLSGIL